MKKCKKLLALTMAVLLAFACFALPSFAASSGSQYGLEATIVTDKESYKANEEIHVTVTVKNTNDFKVEDVSIESLLPETLTLKDGSNSTKTVDLEAGETLTLSFTAVKEKEETSATVPESEGTTPTETETVKPSESETDKPTETETVKPSETETAKPTETETIKPTETETQQPSTQESTEQPTQAPTTEEPTQTTTTAPFTTGEATTLPSTTGTPSTTGGGIIDDLTTTFPKVTTTADSATTAQAENPNTGDSMSVKTLVIAIIALLAVIAVVIILMYKYKKQTTKIISLVMCVAIATTAITGVSFFTAKGADDGRKSFTVEKVITVDGEETSIGVDIRYSDKMPNDKKVEEELSKIRNLNNGELPDIHMNEKYDIPSFIHGMYTDKIIKNGKDAINSLQDIKYLMKIKDPETEFKSISEDTVNEINFYRLQQYYKGIEVTGAQLIITTNKEGTAQSVNGSYYPNNINEEKSISLEKVKNIVINNFEKDAYISGSPKLVYFMSNKAGEYTLAYKAIGGGIKNGEFISGFFIISAQNGEILEFDSLEKTDESVSSSGIDNLGNRREFWTEKISDDLYFLADFSKNISVYDAGNNQISWKLIENEKEAPTLEIHWESVWWQLDSWFRKAKVVQSKNNQWKDKNAVTLFANLCDIYDFYYKELDRCGFDGKNGEVFAIFNDNNKGDWTNAYSTNCKGLDMTLLSFGKNNNLRLDVVAHEYTHSVLGSIVDLAYKGESGAINEAYADIMGEIIENDSSWTHGERKISSPKDNKYPDYYKGIYWIDTDDINNDHGGVHKNSTVISHAAFLMNQKGIPMKELANIFYMSMNYLHTNGAFNDCRESVIQAVKSVNKEHLDIVKTAFDEVGIFSNIVAKTKVRAKFIDGETKDPVQTEVLVHKDNRYGELYNDYTYVTPEGNLYLELPSGKYVLEVRAKDYVTLYIDIDSKINSNISLGDVEIYKTSFIPNPDPTPGIDDKFAGGDGSKENPYQIATAAQLNAVRNHMDSHFVLINDIDLSKYNWEPIGGMKDVEAKDGFQGTFDGAGHTVNRLTLNYIIEEPSWQYDSLYNIGLFSIMGDASDIKNLNLKDVNIDISIVSTSFLNGIQIGSIATQANRLINCSASGKINVNVNTEKGDYSCVYIGGIGTKATEVIKCINNININLNGRSLSPQVGGIVSTVEQISDCTNSGDIYINTLEKNITCGGISAIGNEVTRCKNYGEIKAKSSGGGYNDVGGIIGQGRDNEEAPALIYNANYGNLSCQVIVETYYDASTTSSSVGGIFGSILSHLPSVTVDKCINAGNIDSYCSLGTDGSVSVVAGGIGGGVIGTYESQKQTKIINCYNLCNSITSMYDRPNLSNEGAAARIGGEGANNFSINTTILNGSLPTNYIGPDEKNGGSMTKAEIEKAIQDLGFELPSKLPAAS